MSSIKKSIFTIILIASSYTYSFTVAASDIIIINTDSPNEGFNDTTAVAPVMGNLGTTLGQQRLNVFNAAAQFWANTLNNQIPIRIKASMDPLSCSTNSAVLGGARATAFARNFPGAPRSNTFYPLALVHELANVAGDSDSYEVETVFNSSIGTSNCLPSGWSYVLGVAPEPGEGNSLYTTVVHEIAHGLGFSTLVNERGVRPTTDGITFSDDPYMLNLVDDSTGVRWSNMNDNQRALSSTSNDLAWDGPKVTAALSDFTSGQSVNNRAKIFAPFFYQRGSSVSHFDTSFVPNEMMEPYDTGDIPETSLTKALLCDIGWPCPSSDSKNSDNSSALTTIIFYLLNQ